LKLIVSWGRAALPVALPSVAAVLVADYVFGPVAGFFLGVFFIAAVIVPVWAISQVVVSADDARPLAPPSWPLWVVIALAMTCIALVHSAPWSEDWLLALALGFFGWAVAGTIWLVKLGVNVTSGAAETVRRDWPKWLLPLVVGVAGLVFAVSPAPFMVRFELSKPTLERAAAQVRSGAIQAGASVDLGLCDGWVGSYEGGYVSFGLGDGVGIAEFSAGATPIGDTHERWSHIDGDWWMWKLVDPSN
jgi:hypothetical protein